MNDMSRISKADQADMHMLMDAITDYAIYRLDTEGVVVSWNAGAQNLKGYTADEAVGGSFARFYSAEDRAAGRPQTALRKARTTGRFADTGWRYRKDGSRFWAQVTIQPIYDGDRLLRGYAKVTRDISDVRESQDRLADLARNLDATVTNMSQGISLYDKDERLVLSNGRVERMFGVEPGECVPGMSFYDIVRLALKQRTDLPLTDDVVQSVYRHHLSLLEQPEGGSVIAELTSGTTLSITYRPLPEGGFVAVYEDITERRRWEAHLSYMATHDSLTRLSNRASFNDALDAQIVRAKRERREVALITIDLDKFKEINDTHGHAVGDEVLRRLAKRMSEAIGEDEKVCRFGGDEFAVSKVIAERGEIDDLAARVEDSLTQPLELSPFTLSAGASLGVAIYPQDGHTREQLLNNADLAMYRAKSTIGRTICFYEPRMDECARYRRTLASDIARALDDGEFAVAYQVQKSIQSGEVSGYEALLRWNHPSYGAISPEIFIPVAEESGAILELGEWVLRAACTAAAAGEIPYKVAVNLSPVQMMSGNLVDLVREVLVDTGLSPSRLELEITESTIISDKAHGLHVLRQIKALGVQVALDDFGTGHASLDTLHSFPIDKIKIDRSFLADGVNNGSGWAIVLAILARGRSLGIPVLAEGIETAEQLERLRSEGCQEGQGYFLGRPAFLSEDIDMGAQQQSQA